MTANERNIQILKIKLELKRRACKGSYYEFFKYFWTTVIPDEFIDNWHIEYLCDELQKVGQRVIDRKPKEYDLVINISPGESKSTICTVLFPAWLWVNDPSLVIINNSYNGTLSAEHASLTKDCIKSDKFRDMFGHVFQIRKDHDAKSAYKTDKGGSRIATSTGSGTTGRHGHIIINDDPLSAGESSSEAMLKQAKSKLRELSSRKKDRINTPEILIMQRLHEEDPTAIVLKRKKVKHICLPATTDYEIKPKSLKKYYVNGLMNPSRSGYEVQEEAEKVLGPMDYAGQHGQSPGAIEGNVIKREYLRVISPLQLPDNYYAAPAFTVIDTAQTKKEKNDPTGIGAFKVVNNILYIYGYKNYKEAYEGMKISVLGFMLSTNTRKSPAVVENKSSGPDLIDTLIDVHGINAIPFNPGKKDKMARLKDVLSYIVAGRFMIVKGNWDYEDFINKLLLFPNVAHDEEIDVTVMAINVGLKKQYNAKGGRRTKTI